MMRLALLFAAALVASACSKLAGYSSGDASRGDGADSRVEKDGDLGSTDRADLDATSPRDLPRSDPGVDTQPPAAPCGDVSGQPCTRDSDCRPGPNRANFCLITEPLRARGVCACSCTPDNKDTPLIDEDSCHGAGGVGANYRCASVRRNGNPVSGCLLECMPTLKASTCPNGAACDPRSNALSGDLQLAVCAFAACKADSDCPRVVTSCNTNAPACPGNEPCVAIAPGSDKGRCIAAGACDLRSGLCGPRTDPGAGAVGSACFGDTDCPPNALCVADVPASALKPTGAPCEWDLECCTGVCESTGSVNGPGVCGAGLCRIFSSSGYCVVRGCAFASTLPAFACPAGSTCSLRYPGGLCLRTCSITSGASCRGNPSFDSLGDYECRDWSSRSLGGLQVASVPVCEWGAAARCTGTADGKGVVHDGGFGCGVFGGSDFLCRATDGTVVPPGVEGLCLDKTHSGQ